MTAELHLDLHISTTIDDLDRAKFDQVPFALSRTLNALATKAAAEETDVIFRDFTVRRPARLKKSVIAVRGNKRSPDAIVQVRDTFLVQHEEGGVRNPGDVYPSLVQITGEREKRVGVLRGRNTPKSLLEAKRGKRKPFLQRMGSGKVGVFRRRGTERLPIELVFAFERQVKLKGRLKAEETVNRVAAREWAAEFGAQLARAIATSR